VPPGSADDGIVGDEEVLAVRTDAAVRGFGTERRDAVDLLQRAVGRIDAVRSDTARRRALVDGVHMLPVRGKGQPGRVLGLHDLTRPGIQSAGSGVEVVQVDAFAAAVGVGSDQQPGERGAGLFRLDRLRARVGAGDCNGQREGGQDD
jgi:hypothetical protein